MEFDVDGDADVLPGYDWLRAHDLAGLYDSDAICICAGRGCTSGRRIHLDPRLDPPSSSVTRLKPAAARALLGTVSVPRHGPDVKRRHPSGPPGGVPLPSPSSPTLNSGANDCKTLDPVYSLYA